MQLEATANSSKSDADDEEVQLLSQHSEHSPSSSSSDDGGSLLVEEEECDDDEEAQLSSRYDDSSGSLPNVVEFTSPHSQDGQTINSIVGMINNPVIKSVLESIARDPGHAQQYCNHAKPIQCDPKNEWTPINILYDGLVFAGFDLKRLRKNNMSRKTEWFKSFYGVDHKTAAPYLSDLRNDNPGIDFKDCLMTMNWLTCYDTYPVLSARWGQCEEYIGPKVIEYGYKMAALARKKIIFELEHDVEVGRSVDCFTCMTREMRQDPSSEWFDWKTHSCGLVSSIIFGYCIYVHNMLTNLASLLFTEVRNMPSSP